MEVGRKVIELQNEIYELQKQHRRKEATFTKDKAVLEQRIEILELQIAEGKTR